MLDVLISKSISIIKKGDFVTIYVDVKNNYQKVVNIKQFKINYPKGFIHIPSKEDEPFFTKEEKREIVKQIISSILPFSYLNFMIKLLLKYRYNTKDTNDKSVAEVEEKPESLEKLYEFKVGSYIIRPKGIGETPEVKIFPNEVHRESFLLRAGTSLGRRPRPDTYNISGEVYYDIDGENGKHVKHVDIEVNLFPSVGSMLAGTVIGSALGTVSRFLSNNGQNNLPGNNNVTKDIIQDNPLISDLIIVPLLLNIVLAFIGVVA